MIPKKIFYCWFGHNSKTDMQKECIKSWYDKCPDYEIVELNENNFDVHINEYCSEAYKHGNYAFVSDIARLEALKQHNGFYLDTDIRLLKSLDSLRQYDTIIASTGKGYYNNAPMACANFNNSIWKDVYDNLTLGDCSVRLVNELIHNKYDALGLDFQEFNGTVLLGVDYFITHDYSVSDRTIGIHYCLGSWLSQWTGGYNPANTFLGFEVYQDNIRDLSCEKRYFNNCDKIGRLYTYESPMQSTYKFYGNYFYNKRVQRIYRDTGNRFMIERFNTKPIVDTYKTEGLVIECSKLD